MQQPVARSWPAQVPKSCDIREKHLRQIEEPTGGSPASDAGHRPNGEVELIAGIRQRRAGAEKPDKQGREEEHPLPGVAICDAARRSMRSSSSIDAGYEYRGAGSYSRPAGPTANARRGSKNPGDGRAGTAVEYAPFWV